MKKPILLITVGYPGSGKTYISERLAKDFHFFHLSSDWIRSHIVDNPKYTPEEHRVVFRFMDALALELLSKGISVIYDANNGKHEYRRALYAIAKKGRADAWMLRIHTPIETAEKRVLARSQKKFSNNRKMYLYRAIDIGVIHKLRNEIEEPAKYEQVIFVAGQSSYLINKKIIKKALHL